MHAGRLVATMLCDRSQAQCVVFWQVRLVDPADDPTTCHDRRNRVMAARFCTVTAPISDLENQPGDPENVFHRNAIRPAARG